jgi:long-chain acyl-CoA synthetase
MMNDGQTSAYTQKPWLRHYDYWVPAETTVPEVSIYQTLAQANVHYGASRATAFLGGHLTYAEIKEQADKLATALLGLGVKPGDCVGIMLPNSPQYVISFYAIVRLGAIAVNINPIYTPREVAFVANDSGLRVLITLDALSSVSLGVKAETKIETIIATSVQAYSSQHKTAPAAPEGTLSLSELIAKVAAPNLPPLKINAGDDIATLVYTGGTTGTPKGAMITHSNMWASVVMCRVWNQEYTRLGAESFLLVIPYFHIYGLVVGLAYSTYIGAAQILIPKYDVNMLLAAINTYEPTYFPAVPTLFISLLNHPDAPQSKLNKIKRLNSGSAPLPVEVSERFEAMSGVSVYEGWGMTETTAIGSGTPTYGRRKPGSIGFPFPNTEMKVVDLESGTRDLPVGQEGELLIRGPQIMKGYWNKPEETANVLKDGWLFTGDVARMDEDGTFFIVQRKKDMILVSGYNVYPNEIEDVLFTHPAIKECAVIGIPDEYRGEAVKAFIVLREDATATADNLKAFCAERMAKYKLPTQMEFLAALPKSAVGKVLRRELREMEAAKS